MRLAAALCLALAACTTVETSQDLEAGGVPPSASAESARPLVIELVGQMRQGGFARGSVPADTKRLTLGDTVVPMAEDGGFFVAFARGAPARLKLMVETARGFRFARDIDIAPRSFPEDHLPPIDRPFVEDPTFAARRAAEVERIAAARAVPSQEAGWRQAFVWPAAGRISGVFGSRRFFGDEPQSPHSGTDIAARQGAPVLAPAAGVVVIASPPEYSLEGNLVIVDHGLGLYSSFLHLGRVEVRVGERLEQGARIGAVGATGRTTGPHLHWGVVWNGVRFDPALLVVDWDRVESPL